ncbi:MAG: adenylate/guanylate cyclase domain-containing protein [Lewinellaceae bacterium]|nr:adenylate/guanylate cyclase domain-containing protein [Phaeodactylibacter sp.]MCB9035697.1 adenylate/guanylate cyclase domain-containing protein [Lewinellaceae bacterium]
MLSPKTKRNLYRILPFGIIWLLSGWVFLIVENAAAVSAERLPSTVIQVDFKIFIFSSLAIAGVGLLVGTIELVYLHDAFAKKSFTKKILYKLLIYTLALSLIILITYPIAASMDLNASIFDSRVWDRYFQFLASMTHLSTMVQLGTALGASLFYAEISENIGHGILLNFFAGKYHQPTEEERIFMFLDMKSSTTIAEQLGHIRYFELLKEYYAGLSDAIVEYEGEVYQYVGDEIVISWPYQAGIRNSNCLRCFFAMKEGLRKRAGWYRKKFGVAPTFKAGLHFGKVTTGEIGVLKREIIFTGDVLNATARIQGLCNAYETDLLLSGDLAQNLDLGTEFEARPLGQSELRGRKEEVELYTVLPPGRADNNP